MTRDCRAVNPKEWCEFEMEGWGEEVGKNGWERRRDLFVIEATCPRCRHGFELAIPVGIGTLMESDIQRCSCSEAHHGRPAGKVGCGAYGRVVNPPDAISLAQEVGDNGC